MRKRIGFQEKLKDNQSFMLRQPEQNVRVNEYTFVK